MIRPSELIKIAREIDRILTSEIEIHPNSLIHERLKKVLNPGPPLSDLDIQIKEIKSINRMSILAIIISIVGLLYSLLKSTLLH